MKEKILSQKISKSGNILVDQQGFDSIPEFIESIFHTKQNNVILPATTSMTVIATFTENYFGIKPIILLAILVLFFLEMFTGVLYARRNNQFSSTRAPRGFIKMGVYVIFMGCSHVFAVDLPGVNIPGLDFDLNIYKIFYYTLLNFTIVYLLISNIENFEKLGWDEYVPLVKRLHRFLKLKKTKTDKNEQEEL